MAERTDLLRENGNPKVLIVEDDPVSSLLFQRLFASQGIAVEVAENGIEALELQKHHNFRLVVSDWMMPEMDGVELCRHFRQINGPYVYFILCSAKGQREDRREAFESGVDDFLSKPLDREELQGRLKVARRILSMEEDLQIQTHELSLANENLILASERFQGLFNGLPVACFTFDQDGNVRDWNNQASVVFGPNHAEVMKNPVWQILNPKKDGIWNQDRVRSFCLGSGPRTFDWSFEQADGNVRYLTSRVICIPNISDSTVTAVCVNIDITERLLAENQVKEQMEQINIYAQQLEAQAQALAQMNARLNHLAVTDGLTGLWNQRRFFELLGDTITHHNRVAEPFSLILADIDHFKPVNDEFGHQAGDEMLKEFAEVMRTASRAHELPARYGGEEFAVILRSCGAEEAYAAAERFRIAVEQHDWKYRKITGSFGVATATPNITTERSIVQQADAALYASKAAGRNRVTHYQSMDSAAECA